MSAPHIDFARKLVGIAFADVMYEHLDEVAAVN